MTKFETFGVPTDIDAYQAQISKYVEETVDAYVSAREVERQAVQDLRDEALALARDHDREAAEWSFEGAGEVEMAKLHRHTATFLRYVAGRL